MSCSLLLLLSVVISVVTPHTIEEPVAGDKRNIWQRLRSIGQRDEQTCEIQSANDCPISDLKKIIVGDSIYVQPSAQYNTTCLDGDPYRFVVYPGTSNDLLIYFQGGGGCFDGKTSILGSCSNDASEREENVGVFKRDDARNPYRTYTIVHIMYCTGDLHAGTSEQVRI